MNKVLIIWLWKQWEKYIHYFLKNNYTVYWVCKTVETKHKIQKKYGIQVENDFLTFLKVQEVSIIVIALSPEIQWKIALELAKKYPAIQIIVEIPVSWDNKIIKELKKYQNCIFYLEEYFTLLAKFLRKIDTLSIKKVYIKVSVSKEDYYDKNSAKVTYLHIMNNFLWTNIDRDLIQFSYYFHQREDIFYEVYFDYNDINIHYFFHQEKYLIVGKNKYSDKYNFDYVLMNILSLDKQKINTLKEKYMECIN